MTKKRIILYFYIFIANYFSKNEGRESVANDTRKLQLQIQLEIKHTYSLLDNIIKKKIVLNCLFYFSILNIS